MLDLTIYWHQMFKEHCANIHNKENMDSPYHKTGNKTTTPSLH